MVNGNVASDICKERAAVTMRQDLDNREVLMVLGEDMYLMAYFWNS